MINVDRDLLLLKFSVMSVISSPALLYLLSPTINLAAVGGSVGEAHWGGGLERRTEMVTVLYVVAVKDVWYFGGS